MMRSTANHQITHYCVIKSLKMLIYTKVNSAFFTLNALFCKIWMARGIVNGVSNTFLCSRSLSVVEGSNKSKTLTPLIAYAIFLTGLIAFILTFPNTAKAAELKVAVASNFTTTIKQLKPVFEKQTAHSLSLHFGSTGKLYAQIANGAPFDIFLAADIKRPQLLEQDGMAVKGSRFTYAQGTLVLWAPGVLSAPGGAKQQLMQDKLKNIAITNPKLAPYGMAAKQTLQTYGKWETYQDKLRIGNNISQTYQFVEKGGVAAGMIALAQIPAEQSGSSDIWVIPITAYKPLEQQAVVLSRSEEKEAAQVFIKFLQGELAAKIIKDAGYTLPESGE